MFPAAGLDLHAYFDYRLVVSAPRQVFPRYLRRYKGSYETNGLRRDVDSELLF